MEKLCIVCGALYTSKRSTKLYCTDKCKEKLRRQNEKAKASEEVFVINSTVQIAEEAKVGQTWTPSRRESRLNDIVWKLYSALLDVDHLARRGVASNVLLEATKKARQGAALEDVIWEVEAFDTEQKIYDPEEFEQRTGIAVVGKRAIG